MLRTKIGYAMLLVIFYFFSVLYNTYATYLLFFILLILPFIMWITFFIASRYIDIQMDTPSLVCARGTQYEIAVHLFNRSILPLGRIYIQIEYKNLFTEQINKQELITSLDSKARLQLNFSAISEYCGMCEFRIKKARLMDYLMLFSFRIKSSDQVSIAILPPFQYLDERLARNNPGVLVESELFSSTKSGDDPSEIYGVRPYEQGDCMNRIHWKLSMKQDELMIKQFGLPLDCAVAVLADFYHEGKEPTLAQIDAVIEGTMQLSVSLIHQEQIHFLIWYDRERETCVRFQIEKEEDCYEAASRLYQCKIGIFEHPVSNYHEAQYPAEQYTNIFYVASTISEEMIVSLNRQRKNAIMNVFVIKEDKTTEKDGMMQEQKEDLLCQECMGMGIQVFSLHYGQILRDLLSLELERTGLMK